MCQPFDDMALDDMEEEGGQLPHAVIPECPGPSWLPDELSASASSIFTECPTVHQRAKVKQTSLSGIDALGQ